MERECECVGRVTVRVGERVSERGSERVWEEGEENMGGFPRRVSETWLDVTVEFFSDK